MQKRTRIFAAITVAIGLLLGLGMFATTFFSTAVPAGATNAKKHHHTQTKTSTSTVTSTVTSTITVGPPPPPAPFCFAQPNPVVLSSDGVVGANPAGSGTFNFSCSNLNPAHTYIVTTNLPSGGCAVASAPPASFVSGTITQTIVRPDLDGRISVLYLLTHCLPGTYNIAVFDFTAGIQVFQGTVTLLPPQPAKKI